MHRGNWSSGGGIERGGPGHGGCDIFISNAKVWIKFVGQWRARSTETSQEHQNTKCGNQRRKNNNNCKHDVDYKSKCIKATDDEVERATQQVRGSTKQGITTAD